MTAITNVDEYIASTPEETHAKLKELRDAIKNVAPQAEEKLSYGMPYYHYKGRLAYFRLATHHIGLYIPPPVIQEYADELKEYETAKSTIQFPLEKELPIALIKKLIKAKMKKNDEKEKGK